MTAQGCALRSAWLRAPPQSRRAIFPMCYGIQFTDNHPVDEEAEAKAAAYWAIQDRPHIYRWHSFDWAQRADQDRASPDQAALPVDEWSSRADEPNH